MGEPNNQNGWQKIEINNDTKIKNKLNKIKQDW